MSHLGERVSALIDGELGHSERERALAHLTFCAECRAEVESVRALKNRLRSMEPPAMPADLAMSLLRLAESGGPVPPRMRPFPDHPALASGLPGLAPRDNRPRGLSGSPGPGRPHRARRAGYVVVGMASAAMVIGTMFIVGGAGAHQSPARGEMFVKPPARNQTPVVRATPTRSPTVSPWPSR